MQVANEINSRRINDELTIFSGIHKSPIFMAVIVITCGFQSLIIYTPLGRFFKVRCHFVLLEGGRRMSTPHLAP